MFSSTSVRCDLSEYYPKESSSQKQRKCGDVSISLVSMTLTLHCMFCEFFEDTLECFLDHLQHKHSAMLAAEILWPEATTNEMHVKQEELEINETKFVDVGNEEFESVTDPLMAEEKNMNTCPVKAEVIKSVEPDEPGESTKSAKQNEPDVQLDSDAEKPKFQHICRLIHYVQEHPTLWNTQLGAHYIRSERVSALEGITKLLLQEYPILSIDSKYVNNKFKDLKNIYYNYSNYNSKTRRNKNYEKYFELLHFLKGHEETEETKNLCRVCNKEVASLPSHMLEHHCENDTFTLLKCDACDEILPSAELLEKHMHIVHRRYECKHCTHAPYANSKNLRRHMNSKHPETLSKPKGSSKGIIKERICEHCGKQFMCQNNLYMHIRKVHLQLRPFTCKDCPKAYKDSVKLKAHRNSVHLNYREYVCDVCSRAFFAHKTMMQHKRIHSDAMNYVCRVCGKAFRQAPTLYSHMKIHQ